MKINIVTIILYSSSRIRPGVEFEEYSFEVHVKVDYI